MITKHMPAEILYELLIEEAIFNSAYPLYIGHMPSGKKATKVPAGSVTDTAGTLDGRLSTGTVIEHPGIQLRVRHREPATARAKIVEAVKFFATVTRRTITVEGLSYRVENITRITTVMDLGTQEDQMKNFTVNVIVTIN